MSNAACAEMLTRMSCKGLIVQRRKTTDQHYRLVTTECRRNALRRYRLRTFLQTFLHLQKILRLCG